MKTAFDFRQKCWRINWPQRVSRYDLVTLTPPFDPVHYGLAFGSGEVGGILWTENDRLIIALNRSDLWDDTALSTVKNWACAEEDRATALRHACRLVLDFKQPVFDPLYLYEFQGRVSVADGVVSVHSRSPFGELTVSVYADRLTHNVVCRVQSNLPDCERCEIYAERFGSRTFGHWYNLVRRDPAIGTDGTEAFAEKTFGVIKQQLNGGDFFCRIAAPALGEPHIRHSRSVGYDFKGKDAFTLIGDISAPGEDAALGARRLRDYFAAAEERFAAHQAWWKDFWLASFVDCGKDYRNALWHLYMYLLASCQGGTYPGRFVNGLFGFNRDAQYWTYYFHWNQQELYWSFNAAGHSELCLPYLNYRFRALPYGMADAEKAFGAKGVFVADVCDRLGRNSESEFYNRTPSAEIALDFWRQYCYTRDRELLVGQVVPYMLAAARFLASFFRRKEDGFYHTENGSCYEGEFQIDDPITELACGKQLFPALLSAVAEAGVTLSPEEQALFTDLSLHIAPFTAVEPGERHIRKDDAGRPVCAYGDSTGQILPDSRIFSAGYSHWFNTQMCTPRPEKETYTPFPTAWLCPIFPRPLISFRDKGTPLYDTAVTATLCIGPACMGWDPVSVAMAKLGLGDALDRELDREELNWQRYENGLTHINALGAASDEENPHRFSMLRNAETWQDDSDPRFPMSMYPFRHAELEQTGLYTCAVNEMLLQSFDDGYLAVGPAVTAETDARFTLWAKGNLKVSAEIAGGNVCWIFLEPMQDLTVTLKNPWTDRDDELRLTAGEPLLLTPDTDTALCTEPEDWETNTQNRESPNGKRLGLPQRF